MLDSSPESNWITESQANRIIQVLKDVVGPIAPGVLQNSLKSCKSLSQLLSKIEQQIPEGARNEFRQHTAWLVEDAISDPAFIGRCEQVLESYIGRVAGMLTLTILQQQPAMSKHDFIEVLATYSRSPNQKDAFRQAIMDQQYFRTITE